MIYWVAIVENPTKKEQEEVSASAKLILEPVAIIAKDDKDAAIKVALDPKFSEVLKGANRDRLSVIVRSF